MKKLTKKLSVVWFFVAFALFFVNIPHTKAVVDLAVPVSDAAMRSKEAGLTILGVTIPGVTWDGIFVAIGRQAIDILFDTMIDWINGGADGNPTFATDLEDYMRKLGDQTVGRALDEITDGFACQPFKLEIQAAIERDYGYQYSQRNRDRVYQSSCTLSQIQGNVEQFINGDFNQGGWPAWFRLTQVDENNPYGSYLSAKAGIQVKIAGAKDIEITKLNWSGGFFDTRECLEYDMSEVANAASTRACKKWGPVKTPGTVIANQVNKLFGASTDQLGLADEFDELLSAVVNQLQTMVFNKDGIFKSNRRRIAGTTSYGPSQASSGLCSVDKEDAAIDEEVTWSATSIVSGGNVKYEWSGSEITGPYESTEETFAIRYKTSGDKTVSIKVSYDENDYTRVPDSSGKYPQIRKTKDISCTQVVKIHKYKPLVASCSPDKYVANKDDNGRVSPSTLVVWTAIVEGGSGAFDRVYMRGAEDEWELTEDDGMGRHLGRFINSSGSFVVPFNRTNPVVFAKDGDKTTFKIGIVYRTLGTKTASLYVVDKDGVDVNPVVNLQCSGEVLVQ